MVPNTLDFYHAFAHAHNSLEMCDNEKHAVQFFHFRESQQVLQIPLNNIAAIISCSLGTAARIVESYDLRLLLYRRALTCFLNIS